MTWPPPPCPPSADERPVFLVRLRPEPDTDGVRALRAFLKTALKSFGLRCVGVRREGAKGEP